MDARAAGTTRPNAAHQNATLYVWVMLGVGLAALAVRAYAACYRADDTPVDAHGYARLARNLLEHQLFSSDEAAPFRPQYVRMPGYPVFLAAVYALFGVGANGAVRVVQAVVDTGTCGLAAWLAWLWAPPSWELSARLRAVVFALLLTATCPFVAVYSTTLLTETLTTSAWMIAIVTTTRALQTGRRRAWVLIGLSCGVATSLRPDSGLLVAACGAILLLHELTCTRGLDLRRRIRSLFLSSRVPLLLLALGFGAVLAPWTIRNAFVFGRFMPIPPRYPNLNGDVEEVGYEAWLTTWVDDFRYVEPFEWRLGSLPIRPSQLPPSAFDSDAEKQRVAQLLFRYNHPARAAADSEPSVLMTPGLDAAFGQLARERSARHPWRQHVSLPLRRALGLWFDTHSDFFSFAGPLRAWRATPAPVRAWRALFLALTWLYTLGAALGLYLSRRHGELHVVAWFTALIALPRLWFLGQLPNPEPRYVIELFPCVISLCALPLAASWPCLMQRVRPSAAVVRNLRSGLPG